MRASHEVLSAARNIPWGGEEQLHLSNAVLSHLSHVDEESLRLQVSLGKRGSGFGSVPEGAAPSLLLPRLCTPTPGWRAWGELMRWQRKHVFSRQRLFLFPVLVSPDSWYFAVPESWYFLAASSCCWHLHFMFWVRHPCYIGTHRTILYGQ